VCIDAQTNAHTSIPGENRPDSDIDIMVEIEPDAHIAVFDYVGIKEFIAGLFDGPVDVVNRDNLSHMSARQRRPTAFMFSRRSGSPHERSYMQDRADPYRFRSSGLRV
jgi:hypothetical protein